MAGGVLNAITRGLLSVYSRYLYRYYSASSTQLVEPEYFSETREIAEGYKDMPMVKQKTESIKENKPETIEDPKAGTKTIS